MVRGVDILKRPARAGERPWDCLKGTSVVCVPVHYVLAYINSLEYRGEWDELFLKGIFFFQRTLQLECEGALFSLSYNPDVLILLKLVKCLFMYEPGNWAGSVTGMNFVCSCVKCWSNQPG